MSPHSFIRTRWAAIGAAVAVTLGAGSFVAVEAAVTSGERTVFVSITPCRLVDTRPSSLVGPKASPLGPGETHTVTAHGTTGDCTIPTDALALSLNVTALGATAPTFLAIWPAGAPQPDASSLNPSPGQPPTPNAVTTDLSTDGRFSIFNLQGNVDVLVDVNGYYADHNHDDRYYTEAESDARYATKDEAASAATAQKWISFDPLTVYAKENGGGVSPSRVASWAAGSGLVIPDVPPLTAGPQFDVSFIMPPDYTPGDVLTLEVLWHTDQTACTIELTTNYGGVTRDGGSLVFLPFGFRTADPVPPTINTTARTTFEMRPSGNQVLPGDVISMGVFRSGNFDTCTGTLFVKGIRVLYG